MYQIKGKGSDGNWQWPPLFCDRVSAPDSKTARKQLEDEYGMKLPGGRLKEAADSQQILLTLIDMTDKEYLLERFELKKCKACSKDYRLIDKYNMHDGGHRDYCSQECADETKRQFAISTDINFDFNGIHDAVVYKITNKTTGLCYIGKTTQAFTLRWYQHFYQGAGTKFYNAIKQYGIADWTFEVIEIIDVPKNLYGNEKNKVILQRESYWINKYDSINNGYNSVISLNIEEKSKTDENEELIMW